MIKFLNENNNFRRKYSNYDWGFAKELGEDSEGCSWYVVEDNDGYRGDFKWDLVYVTPDGELRTVNHRIVDYDTYTTSKAYEAIDDLTNDFYDFYNT